jgi:hypothetical protein
MSSEKHEIMKKAMEAMEQNRGPGQVNDPMKGYTTEIGFNKNKAIQEENIKKAQQEMMRDPTKLP